MKTISTQKPPDFFWHTQPRNPQKILIRFCENVQEVQPNDKNSVPYGWEYEEYSIEIDEQIDAEGYIKNHYTELRTEAMGGASAFEQLSAKFDYLSMMTGVDIPDTTAIALDVQNPKFDTVKAYFLQGLWNSEMLQNAVGRWITEEEKEDILSLWQAQDN